MTEQLIIYTIKSKTDGFIWLFKYHLNGIFKSFEIIDGELSAKQYQWLFCSGKFPGMESQLQGWKEKLKDNFEIIKAAPVLDFENLWNLYNHKVKKHEAEKAFKKLKDGDKIKCFLAIPGYNKYLARKGVAKAHLSTFINQRYFEDEWQKAA